MNKTSKERVGKFLQEYPKAITRVTFTLRSGCAVCIKPVPTLFGPEIHCRAEDEPLVNRIKRLVNKKTD